MKEPIIAIPRAPESWIMGLIRLGILEVMENGICCKEIGPSAGKPKGPELKK
ncbi:MAG: hypothetical protein HFH87_00650 [Lachnospiraceae bacterium]|nr:hypothetical protein [Lachnospiraceae bacterium]